MVIIFQIRHYPLSPRITKKHGLLIARAMFVALIIMFVVLFLIDGFNAKPYSFKSIIIFAIPIIFFVISQAYITNLTDEEYRIFFEQHTKACFNLNSNLQNKTLNAPAKINFIRSDKGRSLKYYINDVEYKLKNREMVSLTTKNSLNTIEIKHKKYKDIKYFTVTDSEEIFIEYEFAVIKNVARRK